MASRLEQARLAHQEWERHGRKAIDHLAREPKSAKERVVFELRVGEHIKKMNEAGRRLAEIYEDNDGTRKAEMDEMTGEKMFEVFYDKMKDTREYWRRMAQQAAADGGPGVAEAAHPEPDADVKIDGKFSPAEMNGSFVDMHHFFERYVNMSSKIFDRCDYLTFLNKFDKLGSIDRLIKLQPKKMDEYKKFIDDVAAYLISFHQRIQPLVDVNKLIQLIEADFTVRWDSKSIAGWFDAAKPTVQGLLKGPDDSAIATAAVPTPINQDSKEPIVADSNPEDNPLYCKACKQLYTKDTVYRGHLSGKKHKKAAEELARVVAAHAVSSSATSADVVHPRDLKIQAASRALALTEDKIFQFAELLREQVQATITFIEKKQTRNLDEIGEDLLEPELPDEPDVDDENKPFYNPHNVPLGWDGKPIPYWLYKLHGLNIEYKCQICGGFSYWGPRNFERHFKEWRHEYGMRCLGIKNTDEFVNITRFEDAIALNEKIQKMSATSAWKPEEEEEYEDREGNVYSKKEFEQLKRQGVIS